MSLSDLVSVSIDVESVGISAAGFGVPAILCRDLTGTTAKVVYCSGLTELADYGITSSMPEYKMAQKLLSAATKVQKFALIDMGAATVTQRVKLTAARSFVAGETIEVYVDPLDGTDDLVSITVGTGTFADTAYVLDQIHDAIEAKWPDIACSIDGSALTIDPSNVAGRWVGVHLGDGADAFKVEQDLASEPTVADVLDAALLESAEWYCVLTPWVDAGFIEDIADWTEAAGKLFIVASADSDIENVALASASDIAKTLYDGEYARTALIYHREAEDFADAAWAGKCLPYDPGTETWAYKSLAGVTAQSFTATQRTNILAKKANMYESIAGVGVTQFGTSASGEYVDVTRLVDWLKARIAERVFSRLASLRKLPFTDAGIAVVEAEVRGQLSEGVRIGALAADPEPEVSVPKAADVSASDKTARRLTDVFFTATIAGAIHTLTIQGTLTV